MNGAGPVHSVTRLRLASARHLPRFLAASWRAARQARRAPGFLGLRLLADRRLAFWTATAWADAASLASYVASSPHRAAMPAMAGWCDEGAVVRFAAPTSALGDWAGAHARLMAEGRETPVARPSAGQRERAWALPRAGMGRELGVRPARPHRSPRQPRTCLPCLESAQVDAMLQCTYRETGRSAAGSPPRPAGQEPKT